MAQWHTSGYDDDDDDDDDTSGYDGSFRKNESFSFPHCDNKTWRGGELRHLTLNISKIG